MEDILFFAVVFSGICLVLGMAGFFLEYSRGFRRFVMWFGKLFNIAYEGDDNEY